MILFVIYPALSTLVAFLLRHKLPFFQRVNDWNWQAWVLLDIIAAFLIFWPPYLVGVIDDRPRNGLTVSGYCGRNALMGKRWARVASAVVDRLFLILTSQRDHCVKAYTRWSDPLEAQ